MKRSVLGQSLNLMVELIPKTNKNRSGGVIAPDFITIHNTSNTSRGADANAHSRFVRNTGYYVIRGNKKYVSWHFTVDDKRVVKHLPVNERAIHAGRGNSRSIAIEICMNAGIDQKAANKRAAQLVAALMYDLNISKEDIKPHKFWTGKNCPILLLGEFSAFRDECYDIFASIDEAARLVEPEELMEIEVLRQNETAMESLINEAPEEDDDHEHDLIAGAVAEFIEK